MVTKQDWNGADDPAFCAKCGQPTPPESRRCPACGNVLRLTKQLHLWAFLAVTVTVFLIRFALGTHPYLAAIVSAIAGLSAMTFVWLILRKKLWPYAHSWRDTWRASMLAGIAIMEGGGLACLPSYITPEDFVGYALLLLPLGLLLGLILPLVGPYHLINLLFRDCPNCGATANMRVRYCWRCGKFLPETPITVGPGVER